MAAAMAGEKVRARSLLLEATEIDPGNELAWLWLAKVTESPQETVACLQRVLEINPANKHALARLKWTQSQRAQSAPTWECPLCQATSPHQVDYCPACGAILTLADIDALLNNATANSEQIRETIDRYGSATDIDTDFHAHYRLGLAYLNLKQLDKGTKHLQTAIRLRPSATQLQAVVESLLRRQASAKARQEAIKDQAVQGIILVVDDSPTICRLVSITLERYGYQVISAADGLEALSKMNDRLPDLILLDITMPRMDGYQLCKIVKGNQETKHIPVVMLSGKDGFFDKVRGRMAGSTEYITKPFAPDTLVRAVERYARRQSS
jgi:twitching motility two-component system response regulator PilG